MIPSRRRGGIRRPLVAFLTFLTVSVLGYCNRYSFYPNGSVQWIISHGSTETIQENLARSGLLEEPTRRETDGRQAAILYGRVDPKFASRLQQAGFEYIGELEGGRVYRLDQMLFLLEKNYIVSIHPDRVDAYVGYTGM